MVTISITDSSLFAKLAHPIVLRDAEYCFPCFPDCGDGEETTSSPQH